MGSLLSQLMQCCGCAPEEKTWYDGEYTNVERNRDMEARRKRQIKKDKKRMSKDEYQAFLLKNDVYTTGIL